MKVKAYVVGFLLYLSAFIITGIVQGLIPGDIDSELYVMIKFNITNLLLPLLAALAAGYVVYKLSIDRGYYNALGLGIALVLLDLLYVYAVSRIPRLYSMDRYLRTLSGRDPEWLEIVVTFLTIPMCLLGAWLCAVRKKTKSD